MLRRRMQAALRMIVKSWMIGKLLLMRSTMMTVIATRVQFRQHPHQPLPMQHLPMQQDQNRFRARQGLGHLMIYFVHRAYPVSPSRPASQRALVTAGQGWGWVLRSRVFSHCHCHARYAMKILTQQTLASAPALVGFTCASSATRRSLRQMGAAQVAGSNTTPCLQQKVVVAQKQQQLGLDKRWQI
jgi:hypothetical protein